jgi:putative transposase
MRRKEPIKDVGYYHIGARGCYGRPLFRDESAHELFLELYGQAAKRYGWTTLGWALMWNHHHFLIRLVDGGLSKGMREIHGGFSRRINKEDGLTNQGHLVRHCFFASEAMTVESIKSRARYIDLNPVRAGLCERPEQWRWSSCGATMGAAYRRAFHDPDELLGLFDENPLKARRLYRQFLREGSTDDDPDPWTEQGYTSETDRAMVESVA